MQALFFVRKCTEGSVWEMMFVFLLIEVGVAALSVRRVGKPWGHLEGSIVLYTVGMAVLSDPPTYQAVPCLSLSLSGSSLYIYRLSFEYCWLGKISRGSLENFIDNGSE